MSTPIIEVKNVSKRYKLGQFSALTLRDEAEHLLRRLRGRHVNGGGADTTEFWALSDVSFDVQPGEVLGIIGRNGAGKSTLLKILSRVTEPTKGEIRIRGRVASLLEVGTGFHPELTGRENIYLNGAILGMTRREIRRKFEEIVAFADTERFLDTPVKRYSSGMYVRLAFAVAAHLEPEILIVDEVLAVGDAEFQKKCLGKMRDVSRAGRTVLFVSHNLQAIRRLCDRAILIAAGSVKHIGFPSAIISKYIGRPKSKSVITFEQRPNLPSIIRVEVDNGELLQGNLFVSMHFNSPDAISPVIPGLVVSDGNGVPIYCSNARMHPDEFKPRNLSAGVIRFEACDLPLVEGTYLLSLWLSDWYRYYDHKEHALSFQFRPRHAPISRPEAIGLGSLNWSARWRADACESGEERAAWAFASGIGDGAAACEREIERLHAKIGGQDIGPAEDPTDGSGPTDGSSTTNSMP